MKRIPELRWFLTVLMPALVGFAVYLWARESIGDAWAMVVLLVVQGAGSAAGLKWLYPVPKE